MAGGATAATPLLVDGASGLVLLSDADDAVATTAPPRGAFAKRAVPGVSPGEGDETLARYDEATFPSMTTWVQLKLKYAAVPSYEQSGCHHRPTKNWWTWLTWQD